MEIDRIGTKIRLDNPFIAGNPIYVGSRLFAGREDIFRQIEEMVLVTEQKPTLALHGPRRSGKSSLLLQLNLRVDDRVIPVYVDMQCAAQANGLGEILFYIADRVAKQTTSRYYLELPHPVLNDFLDKPIIAFNAWLDQVESRLENKLILLTLDEFEEIQQAIEAGRLDSGFLALLRNLIQFRYWLVLLFAGVSTLDELGPNWHSYFISVRPIRVSYLEPDEARRLITKPTVDFVLDYEPQAVERIIAATRCQPYLVQLVCFELVAYLNSPERRAQGAWDCATCADVEEAIRRAYHSGNPYFTNLWEDSLPAGQHVLAALASGAPFEADRQVLKRLQRRDIIEPDEACGWRFQVDMVREWVRHEML